MGNIDSDYTQYLKVTASEVVEQFDERYEDPTYLDGTCERCGSLVPDSVLHNFYHRNLSLTLFVFGSTMQSMLKLLEPKMETKETESDGQTPDPTNNGGS